jgi:hypothetical protein
MKSYTDIEQSTKLAEFLPEESADNYYSWHDDRYYVVNKDCPYPYSLKEKIPCWSLAALINIIPQELFDGEYIINITEGRNDRWILTYDSYEDGTKSYYGLSSGANNLIDACVAMIEKLHELNLL